MKKIKGFIFTVDAVFSLIILGIAISAILYFFYENNFTLQNPYISTSTAITSSLFYKMENLKNVVLAAAMVNPQIQNSTWPEYGGNENLSSSTNGYGPLLPLVLFTFHTPTPINQEPSINDGMLVFTTQGPGSTLYDLNPTNGSIKFEVTAPSGNFIGTPLIYNNNIYIADNNGYIYAYSDNGVLLWQQNIGTTKDVVLTAENNYINVNMTLIDPLTGSIVAKTAGGAPSLFSNGEFIQYNLTSPSSGLWEGTLGSFSQYANQITLTWKISNTPTTTSTAPLNPPAENGDILETTFVNIIYIYNTGGNFIVSKSLDNNIVGGASIYNNQSFIQTSNSLYSITPKGAIIFKAPLPTNLNVTPTSTPNYIYTIENGTTLVALTNTGSIVWKASFSGTPINNYIRDIPIAYGNAYIAIGKNLYAIGEPKINPQSTLLQTLAYLYLNNYSSYADALQNATLTLTNTSSALFINNIYAPALSTANFNGYNTYATVSYFQQANPINNMTIALWIDPANTQNADPALITTGPFTSYSYELSLNTIGGNYQGSTLNFSYIDPSGVRHIINSGFSIPSNSFSFVALTFGNGKFNWYYNGTLEANYINMNSIAISNNTLEIGGNSNSFLYNGIISNLQIYNSTLSSKQIYTLYINALAAAPISNSIEGWWPLQGDTNDYSKFHFAYPYNISYTNTKFIPPKLNSAYVIGKSSVPLSINVSGINKIINIGVVEWK
ncbi:MAG: LamG-like jellyroll fold domain-containing protein [Candidatus Micrarchaeia archaeon]